MPASKTLEEAFWPKVMPEPNSGCWLWMGGIQSEGYGTLRSRTRKGSGYAHRISYVLHKGPIPKGLELDHKCRVRCCVNPDHLEPVTRKINVRRGDAWKRNASKTHCPKGHPYEGRNLIVSKRGDGTTFRQCRTCLYASTAKSNRKRRERRRRDLL